MNTWHGTLTLNKLLGSAKWHGTKASKHFMGTFSAAPKFVDIDLGTNKIK